MITFDEARQVVAKATNHPVAPYGWENRDVFLIALDYGGEMPPPDEPDRLVDKDTGEMHEFYGLLGAEPAPDLLPIGDAPE